MKMKIILLSLSLIMISCDMPRVQASKHVQHGITCAWVGTYIRRCENNEVICYSGGEGLQCKWKGK